MDPPKVPKKQTVGPVMASHKMPTLQALSSSLNAGTAKRRLLGQGKSFGWPPAVCPPKRPRPFAFCVEIFNSKIIFLESVTVTFKNLFLRARWPSTEWETGPAQKPEKNGKCPPGLKWPKNGCRNGKNREKMAKIPFWGHFSISVAIFRPFQAGGHFPFFSDFCAGPVSHSVDGHRARKSISNTLFYGNWK